MNNIIATIVMIAIIVTIAVSVYMIIGSSIDEPAQKVITLLDVEYEESSGELVLHHLSGDTLVDVVQSSDGAAVEGWWDNAFSKRIPVEVSSSTSIGSPVQFKVEVVFDSDMNTDFSDIRFVDEDNLELPFWMEEIKSGSSVVCWVNVSSLSVGDNLLYMYFGNTNAESGSDGEDTFPTFVQFSLGDVASYGGSTQDQDPSNIEVLPDNVLRMWGNNWKSVGCDVFCVGDGSQCIDFWFKSTGSTGEINGVGLDDDNSISNTRFYQIFGTQNWGRSEYRVYPGDGDWMFFSLVLDDFSGAMNRFVFCNDADAGQNTNVFFRDVRLRSSGGSSPSVDVKYDEKITGFSGDAEVSLKNLIIKVNGEVVDCASISIDSGVDLDAGGSLTLVFSESTRPVSGDVVTISYVPTNQLLITREL